MQHIMMSKKPYYNFILQKIVNFLVSIFFHIAPYLPRKFLRISAIIFVTPIFLLKKKYRTATIENINIITGKKLGNFHKFILAYKIYCNFSLYFVDIFYFRDKSKHDIIKYLDELSGVPDFEKTLSFGKGAVLLTAHLGNWELGGYFLGKKKLPINVVYFPDRFKKLEFFRSTTRNKMLVNEINVETGLFSAMPIIRALRKNELVAMQGDRDFRADGVKVIFFERQVRFPSGPVICAMAAKSPIIPVFIIETKGNYKIIAKPAIIPTGSIKKQDDIIDNVQRVANVIEEMVRENPTQWYCFYPFFRNKEIQA